MCSAPHKTLGAGLEHKEIINYYFARFILIPKGDEMNINNMP
jgi:hypothetical protein